MIGCVCGVEMSLIQARELGCFLSFNKKEEKNDY